jgi:hypothetical protein
MQIISMRFLTVATVAALASTAMAENDCFRQEYGQFRYFVTADVPAAEHGNVCGALWDNLAQFKGGCYAGLPSCGKKFPEDPTNETLQWTFETGITCDSGMVEATWWDATENKFGGINC